MNLKATISTHGYFGETGSVVWSGSMDVDKGRTTSSANFRKENI